MKYRIHVNHQSKGKPEFDSYQHSTLETRYSKDTIGKTLTMPTRDQKDKWHELHPELICLTPTGELAGEGDYQTRGNVIWQWKDTSGKWYRVRNEFLNKGKPTPFVTDDFETRAIYIVTTPANEQPKEESFQYRVNPWLLECFGQQIANDKVERNYRFIEEALELVQSTGCSKDEVLKMVGYVYSRPIGDPFQEVGGVMVTLAALCLANNLNMHENAETELARIWTKVEKIRAKQVTKDVFGVTSTPAPSLAPVDESVEKRAKRFLQTGPYDKINVKGQGMYYTEWSAIRAIRDFNNECLKEHVRLDDVVKLLWDELKYNPSLYISISDKIRSKKWKE